MSLTLNIYDEDVIENKNRLHLGDYILEEVEKSGWNNIKMDIMRKVGDELEMVINNCRFDKFFVDYSKRNGRLKLMVGQNPNLFVKSEKLVLFKDRMKEICGYWDVLRNEYLVGMKGVKKTLFIMDIFYQNEFEFNIEKELADFKEIAFTDILFCFNWNNYKKRFDFYITNKFNKKLVKIIFDTDFQRWEIREQTAIILEKIIDIYFYDKLLLFTERGVFDGNEGDWIFKLPKDYILKKVYKTVNSKIIWLETEYKNEHFRLKQIYVYTVVGDFYHKLELNIDYFHFNAFYFRYNWVCRFESPICSPILINDLFNKKSFYIPIGSSKVGKGFEYEEKKDYIEYKRRQLKYILFKRKNLASNVFVFLSSSHLNEIKYSDELFENQEANRKIIYPSYIFTKPEYILKIAEHYRLMFNLKPNQILIEWTDNKNNIPIKLTETIDFFLLNDGLGTICFYNQLIKDFQKKYTMEDKNMKYNGLLDTFLEQKIT